MKDEVSSSILDNGSNRRRNLERGRFFMDIQILTRKFCDHSTFIRGYSKDTIKRYKQVIKSFSEDSQISEIEEVTDDKVRDYFYKGRTIKKWSANSFITYHKSLVVFFRWCVQEKLMAVNPAEDLELPKLEKRLPPKLSKQEVMRILEVVYNYPYRHQFLRYRNYAIFSTFILAGLRKSELLRLKLTDVDLENLSIYVKQGKGNKDRIVPICYKLADALKKYLIERNRLKKTCPEFFVSLNHNMGFTDNGLKHLMVEVVNAYGKHFSVHKLRHTFATLMIEGGCDIYSLSKMMGHSDIKTTTIYLAATAEHLRSQISKHPLNDL